MIRIAFLWTYTLMAVVMTVTALAVTPVAIASVMAVETVTGAKLLAYDLTST